MNSLSPRLRALLNVKTGNQPLMIIEAADSFDHLRAETLRLSGIDFLAVLGDCFRPRTFVKNSPGSITNSLHKTGCAFDYNQGEMQLRLVRETFTLGGQPRVRWRTYLRITDPAKFAPSKFVSIVSVRTENAGGYQGWALDFTALAESMGWERIPAHRDWMQKGHWTSREFWHYQYARLAHLGYDALMKFVYG
jgi:hypothetical protein